MPDLSTASPLEITRLLIATVGFLTNAYGIRHCYRIYQALSLQAPARRRLMAKANMREEVLFATGHLILGTIAWFATQTPDGPINTLSLISNIGQILIGGLLFGMSVMRQHTRESAELMDDLQRQVDAERTGR